MELGSLGKSGLQVAPLALGGNVFGWTADESTSFRLLDAFVDAGFNLIDTADCYARWVPGNKGGESETLIGKWLQRSKKRTAVILATKVGFEMGPGKKGLRKEYILRAVEDSLRRLQIETIDLYQSHIDDPETDVEETLEAFTLLVRQGKVRAIGASQLSPERLRESLQTSVRLGLESYTCLQPLYNLYDRDKFENTFAPVCKEFGLGVINYYSLASGFLSGKYRIKADLSKSVRGNTRVQASYFNDRGFKILRALDIVSTRVNAPLATIAVAWVLSNPLITAAIASATNLDQLAALIRAPELRLDTESLALLNEASA